MLLVQGPHYETQRVNTVMEEEAQEQGLQREQ